MRPPLHAVLLASIATAGGGQAFAQAAPASAALAWTRAVGADACPAGDVVADRVRARLGRDPFVPPFAQVIETIVTHTDTGWNVEVFVRDPHGALVARQALASTAVECDAITDAAVLAIAVAIDPDAALAPRAPLPTPSPASVPAPPREPARPPLHASPRVALARPRRARREQPLLGRAVRADGVVALGLLPGLAAGAAIEVDPLRFGRLRASAGALLLPETRVAVAGHPFAFGLTAFDVAVCGDLVQAPRTILAACIGAAVGVIHSVVFDLTPAQPGESAWVAASADVRWMITVVEPFAVQVHVGAVVPITRYDFRVDGPISDVFGQSAIALVAGAGVGVRFR